MKEIPLAIARYIIRTGERSVGIDGYKVSTQELPGLEDDKVCGVLLGLSQVLSPTVERWYVNDEKTNRSDSLDPAIEELAEFGGAVLFDSAATVATAFVAGSVAALYTRNPEEIAGAIIAAKFGFNASTHIAIDSAVAIKNRFANKLTSLKH